MSNSELRQLMKEILDISKQSSKETANDIKEIRKLQKETEKLLKETNYTLNGYTKNEATAIEEEVNIKVSNLLKRKFSNFNIYSVDTWKTLQKNKITDMDNKVRDKKSITEFDGLFIVSNDPEYYSDNLIHKMSNASIFQNTNTGKLTQKQFVVVESKHDLDFGKVNHKISQMITFKNYIEESLNPDPKIYTKEFIKRANFHELPGFIGSDLYLIFASPYIPNSCIDMIKANAISWVQNHRIHVGFMRPSGNRYNIAWVDDNFAEKSNVNTTGLMLLSKTGGKKIKRS